MSDENKKGAKSIEVVKIQDDPLSDLGNMDGEWSQLIRSSEGFLIAGAGSSGDGSSGGCSGSGGCGGGGSGDGDGGSGDGGKSGGSGGACSGGGDGDGF